MLTFPGKPQRVDVVARVTINLDDVLAETQLDALEGRRYLGTSYRTPMALDSRAVFDLMEMGQIHESSLGGRVAMALAAHLEARDPRVRTFARVLR